MSWLQEEPTLASLAAQQVRRITGRALRRPILTTAIALAVAAVLFVAQARRPKLYDREVGLLITEGAFAPDGRQRPQSELRSFIDRAVFTKARLEELITKHGLIRKLRAPNLEVAVDRLRQNIDVGIWHDYFEGFRGTEGSRRSVRVGITVSAPDPDAALAVARDLGQMVAETQIQREADSAAERVKSRRILAESAAARASDLHEELERMKVDVLEKPGGEAYVGLQRLRVAVQAADADSAARAGDLVDAQLRERAVHRVGHLVQIVDPGIPLWYRMSRAERLAGQCAVSLGVGVFLAVFLIGAFDPTIRDEHDLRRMGISYWGNVPSRSD